MTKCNAVKMGWMVFVILLSLAGITLADDLFIDPASPLVEKGGQITLSVTNASGDVMWTPAKGLIEGTGNSFTYLAPDEITIDSVMALDDAGNAGMVRVVVMEKPNID